MDDIDATWMQLIDDTAFGAAVHMRKAIEAIDANFGEGYAKKNPALVGDLVRASGAVLVGAHGVVGMQNLRDALHDLAAAVRETAS